MSSFEAQRKWFMKENSIKVINFLLLKVKNLQYAAIQFIILQMSASSHLFPCSCHVSAWGIYI